MRAGAVHHLAVCVQDLARAERFYVDLLGLPVLRRWDDAEGRPRSVWLDLGDGSFLAVERAAVAAPLRAGDAPGWHCVALRIARAHREQWRGRLEAAGHPVERESDYTLYVRDPEGTLVALSHHPEPAVRD